MPKDIQDFDKMEEVESRHGGKKVDWAEVVDAICAANQAFTVKEVWEQFAQRKVTQFRTKGALDKQVEDHKLRRLWDGKRFYYGPYVEDTAAETVEALLKDAT